jgi:hypothetical protein
MERPFERRLSSLQIRTNTSDQPPQSFGDSRHLPPLSLQGQMPNSTVMDRMGLDVLRKPGVRQEKPAPERGSEAFRKASLENISAGAVQFKQGASAKTPSSQFVPVQRSKILSSSRSK